MCDGSVYRVWTAAGRLAAAGLSSRPGRSPQTGSDPRRSPTGHRCCRIFLRGGTNRTLSGEPKQAGQRGPRLTVERVAQVDLVAQRVAQLHADKLAVPGALHKLFAVTVGGRVRGEGELGPDGVLPCGDADVQQEALEAVSRSTFLRPHLRRSRSPADQLERERTRGVKQLLRFELEAGAAVGRPT